MNDETEIIPKLGSFILNFGDRYPVPRHARHVNVFAVYEKWVPVKW